MSIMKWSEKLDIGVNAMNLQHQKILDLMNNLHDLSSENAIFSEQLRVLDELANYTVKHFKEEEQYMESIAYEGIVVHKKIHEDLLGKFSSHVKSIKESETLSDDFFNFLVGVFLVVRFLAFGLTRNAEFIL